MELRSGTYIPRNEDRVTVWRAGSDLPGDEWRHTAPGSDAIVRMNGNEVWRDAHGFAATLLPGTALVEQANGKSYVLYTVAEQEQYMREHERLSD